MGDAIGSASRGVAGPEGDWDVNGTAATPRQEESAWKLAHVAVNKADAAREIAVFWIDCKGGDPT